MSPAPARRALGAVLAGGAGRRLGGEKAGALLAGRPLISYPLAALGAAGIEAAVWAKPGQELPPLALPVHREPASPRHPLTGIVAALRASAATAPSPRPLIAIACDLPFVAPELLTALAATPEPLVVTALDGRPQPLLARYDTSLLAELEAALEAEEPLTRTVERLRPRTVDSAELARFGDPARLLFNVNDAEDLRRAEAFT